MKVELAWKRNHMCPSWARWKIRNPIARWSVWTTWRCARSETSNSRVGSLLFKATRVQLYRHSGWFSRRQDDIQSLICCNLDSAIDPGELFRLPIMFRTSCGLCKESLTLLARLKLLESRCNSYNLNWYMLWNCSHLYRPRRSRYEIQYLPKMNSFH